MTEGGLTTTTPVNHFGRLLPRSQLFSQLMESEDPRVVNDSSMLYKRAGATPLDDRQLERKGGRFKPHSITKLAYVLFTLGLHRR